MSTEFAADNVEAGVEVEADAVALKLPKPAEPAIKVSYN